MSAPLVDRLLACLAPWQCVLCREPAQGMDLCADCLIDLPWLGHCCRGCARPLAAPDARLCGACMNQPPNIDLCVAALAYQYPVNRLITGLKYQRKLVCARVLGELLAIRIQEAQHTAELELPQQLLPVPMHHMRQLRRHFNQAEQISRWLSQDIGVPVNPALLQRVRNTPPQTELSRAARLHNLAGAFRLTASVQGRSFALVDDVITTSATVRALAKLLKRGGAAEVQVWAVARTDA